MDSYLEEVDTDIVVRLIEENLNYIREGSSEQVLRDNFTSYLRNIFDEEEKWVTRYVSGTESAVSLNRENRETTGFVDNLVDATAIEYESNLDTKAKYEEGYNQVKEYCAAIINAGFNPDYVVGILSDTIRWYAYSVLVDSGAEGDISKEDIELIEIEFIDLSGGGAVNANKLLHFLKEYFARIGSRLLTADSIAKDLGFESDFGKRYVEDFEQIIEEGFRENPVYYNLISNLWCEFVSYLREEGYSEDFDLSTYVDEYYLSTVGKLICANFLEKEALLSNREQLRKILDGRFFENKGILNLVEYDYFGWINDSPILDNVLDVASQIQTDLMAYDFTSELSEDLFGKIMAQLAQKSQRILLGQEWTPSWLSRKVVENVVLNIPDHEPLALLDMCCGSGSMIVESLDISKDRILAQNQNSERSERIELLRNSVTGFDIDPLAVILSKINWVLTAKDWLEPLGAYEVVIPIYHADSLFAKIPLANSEDNQSDDDVELKVADYSVNLPSFLIHPAYRTYFDDLIDKCYRIALIINEAELNESDLNSIFDSLDSDYHHSFNGDQKRRVKDFITELVIAVHKLDQEGRNGIWAFIIRNSYRPELVHGQFNGLVSNPPWLALSKLANNPYQEVLKQKAGNFGIKPTGSSHLHIELATIFLLHATRYYLSDGAAIGCIVPDTVLNGHHHNPFRKGEYNDSYVSVKFDLDEIWKIEKGIFKNIAVVLFGGKRGYSDSEVWTGKFLHKESEIPDETLTFYKNQQGERVVWSQNEPTGENDGFFDPADFRQGADIMPRNLLFYDVEDISGEAYSRIKTIRRDSDLGFTVKLAKKHTDFSLSERLFPNELIFDVITSNLVTPFDVAAFQKAILPIEKNRSNEWESLSEVELSSYGTTVSNTFQSIIDELDEGDTVSTIMDRIDTRGKLSQQFIPQNGFMVFTGAGGSNVCSAYINLSNIDTDKLIIDQTLYWAVVESEGEAIYLSGLLNSEAINEIIKEFQPRGDFGERHIHKLPFRATPPYDSEIAAHEDVVSCTSTLIQDYELLKRNDEDLQNALNPNSSPLHIRRKRIFEKIKNLDSYNSYEEACRALYGL